MAVQFLFFALSVEGEKKMKNKNIISGILAMAVMLGFVLGCQFTTKFEINNGEIEYKNVSNAEAQKLGYYLVEEDFFDGRKIRVKLDKSGSTYQFRMVVKSRSRNNQSYHETVKLFAEELSADVFDNAPTEIHICDDDFETIVVIKS